ncbi:MAG TPA: c-type cytochrome [Nitrospirae bacterium]|nr:c-type cytochrome [Nitrospirota bacterium]
MKNVMIAAIFALFAFTLLDNAEAIHNGWFAPDEVVGQKNPFLSDKGALAEGKKVYKKNCMKCHGPSGKGDGASAGSLQIELPDFSDKGITMEETDGAWFWKVRVGQFEMPPFQLALKDDQIWKAIIYVRSLAK